MLWGWSGGTCRQDLVVDRRSPAGLALLCPICQARTAIQVRHAGPGHKRLLLPALHMQHDLSKSNARRAHGERAEDNEHRPVPVHS